MRYKVVPPVRDPDFLREARDALPLVPGSAEDCCSRIRDRTDCTSRDEAREYLTFLQALGLAAESDRGYHRTRETLDDGDLAEKFREHVFGAKEVLSSVETADAAAVEDAFEALSEEVPRWERDRHADWEGEWRERTERLLGWAVAFGLLEADDDGAYRPRR